MVLGLKLQIEFLLSMQGSPISRFFIIVPCKTFRLLCKTFGIQCENFSIPCKIVIIFGETSTSNSFENKKNKNADVSGFYDSNENENDRD